MHKWEWREEEPFPPIKAVFGAGIWVLEEYQPLREKLMTAIPEPKVTYADATFTTVDALHNGGESTPSSPSSDRCNLNSEILVMGMVV